MLVPIWVSLMMPSCLTSVTAHAVYLTARRPHCTRWMKWVRLKYHWWIILHHWASLQLVQSAPDSPWFWSTGEYRCKRPSWYWVLFVSREWNTESPHSITMTVSGRGSSFYRLRRPISLYRMNCRFTRRCPCRLKSNWSVDEMSFYHISYATCPGVWILPLVRWHNNPKTVPDLACRLQVDRLGYFMSKGNHC